MNSLIKVTATADKVGIKPKPTKREIVESMVELQATKLTTEKQAALKRRDQIRTEATPILLKQSFDLLKDGRTIVDLGYANGGENYVGVRVTIVFRKKDIAPALDRLLVEYHKASATASMRFDREQIRKDIQKHLSGQTGLEDRVEALLEVPEIRKQLESALQSMTA